MTQAQSPRPVTRGESLPVSVDWLAFTVRGVSPSVVIRTVRDWMQLRGAASRPSGLHGYTESVSLEGLGVVAWGGESQGGTVYVSISGAGCRRIVAWDAVRAWGEAHGAKLTRLDLAADDFAGAVFDPRGAVESWKEGLFSGGGRPPKARLVDDLGCGTGCTFYVGNRASGKVCRVYHKGLQLGDPRATWVRAEVELLAKDRVIPWSAVTDPVPVLAGSYKYFAGLSYAVEMVRTVKRIVSRTLEGVRVWVRTAAGRALTALLAHDGDAADLLQSVMREGRPRRLVMMVGGV